MAHLTFSRYCCQLTSIQGFKGRPSAGSRSQRSGVNCAAQGSEVTLLDYGAGNVRSVRNAVKKLGFTLKEVKKPEDILAADKLLFPGVGAYEQAMGVIQAKGYTEPLKEYIQLLFEGSEENGGVEGLGVIPGSVRKFDTSLGLPVPHIGWNDLDLRRGSPLLRDVGDRRLYFVHSYRAVPTTEVEDWVLATSEYGGSFVSVVERGAVAAVQFHPEKSGDAGLTVIRSFLEATPTNEPLAAPIHGNGRVRGLARRVIACLDVRANDAGDLVVTKGDQYDVREAGSSAGGNEVRNLGMPVDLAGRYFAEGADEVTFLNITGFRDFPLGDLPMLEVLRQASKRVFVPLTVGGGIRDFTDAEGRQYSALDVAAEYFRSGADKVSIGSDAVYAAEKFLATGEKTGESSIEQISWNYGAQAVVVSVDPRRVYVEAPADTPHSVVETSHLGPNGERYCWWQCTVNGGRQGRDLDAVELARAVEALGAGEILLNCIDNDGQAKGFDLELVEAVSRAVSIPVIASSGAGCPDHFSEVFQHTRAAAALAAGIFHRQEVSIGEVKGHMAAAGIATRML